MSHFGFLMMPEPGHTLPVLNVARKLEQRGHAITFLSSQPLQGFFRRYGFHCEPVLADILYGEPADFFDAPPSVDATKRRLRRYLESTRVSLSECLASELRPIAFDTLICDYSILQHCGPTFTDRLRRPVIALRLLLPDTEEEELIAPEVILCPPEFDLPQSRKRHLRRYCEPSVFLDRLPFCASPSPLTPSQRLVCCSFGTQLARYKNVTAVLTAVLEAFASMPGLELLIPISQLGDDMTPIPLPSNVTLVRTVQQLEILRRCNLFITHGGLGGLKESILFGVPTVVIPFDSDQPRNAERIEHHNLGRRCQPLECTPEKIRQLVESVLTDASVSAAVTEMQKLFWDYEQSAPAVDFISAL